MAIVSTSVSISDGAVRCTTVVSPIVSIHPNSILTHAIVSVAEADEYLITEAAYGTFIRLKPSQRAYRNGRPLVGIEFGTRINAFGILCDVNPCYYTTMGVKVYEITLVVAGAVYCRINPASNTELALNIKSPSQKNGWATLPIGRRRAALAL